MEKQAVTIGSIPWLQNQIATLENQQRQMAETSLKCEGALQIVRFQLGESMRAADEAAKQSINGQPEAVAAPE